MLKWFSIFFSIVVIIITIIPFISKTRSSPPDNYFSLLPNGIILQDYYSDLSSIYQGATIFKEIGPYTTEDIKPEYLHIYYLIAGKIGGIFGLNPIQIYYICTYSTLVIMFIFIYLLVSTVVPKSHQLFSLFLIYFASPLPGEVWWTNQSIYNRFLMRPHHLAGVTILIACSYFFIKFYRRPKIFDFITCGLLCFFGLIFSGTPGIIFLSVISVFLMFSIFNYLKTKKLIYKNRALGIFAIFVISIPALLFLFLQITSGFYGTIVGNWEFTTFQKEIHPYTFKSYLWSLGFLSPLVFLSLFNIIKKRSFEYFFILLLFLAPFCFYFMSVFGIIHINKMRFIYSAPYVFGSILAAFGVLKFKKYLLRLIIILFVINSLISLKTNWLPWISDKAFYYNIYIPKSYFSLFSYINTSLPPFSKIMTSFGVGNFLPSFSSVKVFVGNEVSTMNFHIKYQISENIYIQKYSLKETSEIFKQYNIRYLLWDNPAPPSKYLPILKNIFQKDNIILYEVI